MTSRAPSIEADRSAIAAIVRLRARGRHREAQRRYGEVIGRHQRRACRIACRYLRDPADADEAVQDAFVKAYAHLASFRGELSFEVWFTRILINRCLDRLRVRRRRERWHVSLTALPPAYRERREELASSFTISPEERVLTRERRRRLAAALTRLPACQRTVVELSHFEGLTSPEVSARTGINASTVRVHLFRAMRNLRVLLSEECAA